MNDLKQNRKGQKWKIKKTGTVRNGNVNWNGNVNRNGNVNMNGNVNRNGNGIVTAIKYKNEGTTFYNFDYFTNLNGAETK